MAKKTIRLGLIGCGGNMRGAHLPRLQADGGAAVVAVADPVRAQAEGLMERLGEEVPYFDDYRKLLRQEGLDGVVISTPHDQHIAQVRAALNAGLHVLVEKPLTIDSRHSKALIELARRKRRLMVVAYQRHFLPEYVYARELVRQRKLGQIRGVVGYVTQNWGAIGSWRMDSEQSGGGMFMDTGSHLVASSLWVTGMRPIEVSAYMDNARKPVDINAVVNVRFANGALGTLDTFGNSSRHDERLAIHGSKGVVVIRQHQWRVKSMLVNDEPAKIPARIRPDTPDAAFLRWLRNGGKGYERPDFALQVSRVSEAAYQSLAKRRPVRVRT
ncbi:MAG: Gfo/Idh/MocA family oxidoreductase [Gammaproteobacteria bacterium]|jgi:predicted dehydrogenase